MSQGKLMLSELSYYTLWPRPIFLDLMVSFGVQGSDVVHFQDFNAEVLRCLTIPNLSANLSEKSSSVSVGETEVRFFAGEWSEVHQVLPLVNNDGETNKKGGYDVILMAETIYSISAQKSLYQLIKRVHSRILVDSRNFKDHS